MTSGEQEHRHSLFSPLLLELPVCASFREDYCNVHKKEVTKQLIPYLSLAAMKLFKKKSGSKKSKKTVDAVMPRKDALVDRSTADHSVSSESSTISTSECTFNSEAASGLRLSANANVKDQVFSKNPVVDDASKYGYEDAPPDSEATEKYGYGDGAPQGPSKTLRRSSLKAEGTDWANPNRPRRRASIGCAMGDEIAVNIRGQDKPVRRRRSITFNEECNVRTVKPVTHIEEVKPEDIWFQEHEFNRIQKKIVYLVDEVSKGNDKGFCLRGLESLVGDQGTAKLERRYGLYDSVYEEQEYQKEYGIYGSGGDEGLSHASRMVSKASVREAQERAQRDSQDIERYLQSTRRQIRRRMSM